MSESNGGEERRSGSRAASILLLVGSALISILLVEAGLKIFYPQDTMERLLDRTAPMYISSDVLPSRLRPNATGRLTTSEFDTSIEINSLGFRGEEFDPEKGDRWRVLTIGDSFTFGYGIEAEETYSKRLERLLEDAPGLPPVQVINCGFASGYYPDTYYLWLKEFGLDLDPDLVIVGFFVGNDVDHDKVTENVWTEVDAQGLPTRIIHQFADIEDGYRVRKVKQWRYRIPLVRNSHLAQAIATAFFAPPLEPQPEPAGRSGGPRKRPRRTASFNLWMYLDEYLPRTEFLVDRVQTLFLAMNRLTDERGIPMLVVIIPAREQVRPEAFDFDSYPGMEGYDLTKPQRLFARFFDSEGIPYVDLLPLLAAQEQPVFFERNLHWNAFANELAARRLAAVILEKGWHAEPTAPPA